MASAQSSIRAHKHNPYDPSRHANEQTFVGREEILQRLVNDLRSGFSYGLIGEPGIGKTSLLFAINRELRRTRFSIDAMFKPIPIYLEFNPQQLNNTGAVLEAILQRFVESLEEEIGSICPEKKDLLLAAQRNRFGPPFKIILDWCYKKSGQSCRFILLFDDLHRGIACDWLGEAMSILRPVVSFSDNIALILSGEMPLEKEFRSEISPLRNLVSDQVTLPVLAFDEVDALVKLAPSYDWEVEPGSERLVYALTQGHPYRVHYYLRKVLSQHGRITKSALTEIQNDKSAQSYLNSILKASQQGTAPEEGGLKMEHKIQFQPIENDKFNQPRYEAASFKGKIDFGIITIKEEEFRAVLERFNPDAVIEGNRYYALCRVKISDSDYFQVAIVRCPEQGTNEGQNVARDMIEDLDPQWLLLVGIAGAIPACEFTLGDVVIATRLHDFCVEAALEGRSPEYGVAGGSMHPVIQGIVANLPAMEKRLLDWNGISAIGMAKPPVKLRINNFYGDADWQRDVKESLTAHFGNASTPRPPKYTAGAIVSSDRLVKNSEIIKAWKKAARQMLAVEMELAGVYHAARRKDREYPILAIRGISDIVGFRRNANWTIYACKSAASFAYAFVKAGFITSRISRTS
jgi:nucleoside phosphorylase/AAA+ ATPase superfamily predicted ATPase